MLNRMTALLVFAFSVSAQAGSPELNPVCYQYQNHFILTPFWNCRAPAPAEWGTGTEIEVRVGKNVGEAGCYLMADAHFLGKGSFDSYLTLGSFTPTASFEGDSWTYATPYWPGAHSHFRMTMDSERKTADVTFKDGTYMSAAVTAKFECRWVWRPDF